MRLHYREYGETGAAGVPVLLLHGLLGSAANWHGIARRLAAAGRYVVAPDLRNHGRSPHAGAVGYPELATDVLELLGALGQDRVDVVGHSMGGKAAMWLALTHPARVGRLLVADIAPVNYPARLVGLLDALLDLPLGRLADRADADRRLAVPDAAVRAYLLQNLVRDDGGAWAWRANLAALRAGLDEISGFPRPPRAAQFPGKTLFLYGGRSDYVQPAHHAVIRAWFPFARLRALPGAGHWLYAEQPDAFFGATQAFLG